MENTSKVTALVPVQFLNGNSIVGPKVLKYAERYQTFLNQTAASILALTETVYEAKYNLSADEFKAFTKEVGLKSKATVSKFIAIGENVSRLEPYKSNLPCSWTTLYKLVRMEQSDFDEVKDFLFTDMTASDIEGLLGNATSQTRFVDKPDIKIYFGLLCSNDKIKLTSEIHRLCKKYKVNYAHPSTLSEDKCNQHLQDAA